MQNLDSKKKLVFWGIGLGWSLMALGAIFVFVLPVIMEYKLRSEIYLYPDSRAFSVWRETPVDLVLQIWFFNVTNADRFLNGQDRKLKVKEVGPYSYREHKRKEIECWDALDDTVTFRDNYTFYFLPDKSGGSENDAITTINTPLVSIVRQARKMGSGIHLRGLEVLSNLFGETVFTRRSVRELLFDGYHVPMVDVLQKVSGKVRLPGAKFGYFHGRNSTPGVPVTIYTGRNDPKRFAQIRKMDNASSVSYWNDQYCNMINGTDGTIFGPIVTKDTVLRFFSPLLCKSSTSVYRETVYHSGIETYRFSTNPAVFGLGASREDVKCFCSEDGRMCPSDGVLATGACGKGPIVFSFPHFLNAQTRFLDYLDGVRQDPENHQSFGDVDPLTGFVINCNRKGQINIHLQAVPELSSFQSVPKDELLVPVLWFNESGTISDEYADNYHATILTPILVWRVLSYSALVLGFVLTVSSLAGFFYLRRYEDNDNNDYYPNK